MNCMPLIGRAWKLPLAIGCAFALLGSSPVFGQGIHVPSTPVSGKATTSVGVQYGHLFKADMNNGGDVERDSASLGLSHRIKLNDKLSLALQAGYQLSAYDFSPSTSGPNAFQWDDIHEVRGVAMLSWKVNDQWSLITAGAVFAHAEGGADFSRGLTGRAGLGFEYRANENLKLGLLVVAASEIEDSVTVLPLPRVDWKFADNWRWRVNMMSTFGGRGIGTELSVTPTEEWEIAIGITHQRKRFRLNGGDAIEKGVGEESSLPAFVRIGFKPTPGVLLNAMVGVAFSGQLKAEDRDGNRLETEDFDPAPIVGIGGRFSF